MEVNLDLTNATVFTGNTIVPIGNYPVQIASAEPVETKAKDGWYIKVGFKIVSGDYSGITVTDIINVGNKKEDIVRIAYNQLKTILTVGGHNNPNALKDTNELVGLKLNIYVEEEESDDLKNDGTPYINNRVKSYYAFDDANPPTGKTTTAATTKEPKATPMPAPITPAPAAAAFPWMK